MKFEFVTTWIVSDFNLPFPIKSHVTRDALYSVQSQHFDLVFKKNDFPNDKCWLNMFVLFLADNEAPNVTCPTDNTTNVDASLAGAFVIWSVSPNATDVVDATVNADSVVCEDHLGNVVTSGEFFQGS